MDIEKMLDEITPDMLPKPYSIYAEAIGIRNLFILAALVGGKTIYIPKRDALFKEPKRLKVIEDYGQGKHSYQDLADTYGISKSTVSAYIKTEKRDG